MRTTFSNEEIVDLKKNPCVFNCTAKSVHYTYEFKRHALGLYSQGIGPKEIWRRAGFNVSKWKKDYFVLTLRDWRKIVARDGTEGLNKMGGLQYDRGPSKEEKDKIKRLELQVKYLRAENDFLAKLRAKRAERNSGRTKNTGLYEI
jgi:transposase-like protein